MSPHIDDLTTDRQRRLFACACCRSVWHLLLDPRSRDAVEVAERYADGLASGEELRAARAAALEVLVGSEEEQQWRREHASTVALSRPPHHPPPLDPDALALHNGQATNPAAGAAHAAVDSVGEAAELAHTAVLDRAPDDATASQAREAEATKQDHFLRDIAGVPDSASSLSPEWRTHTALSLAAQMYASRDFTAMPILADALKDAGCDSDDILDHCRGPGPHVRGCWVVDLVLGKE